MLQREVFGRTVFNITLLRDIEFLLTSGVRGLGYHLGKYNLTASMTGREMEMSLEHLLVVSSFLLSSFNMNQGHNVPASSSPGIQDSMLPVGNIQLTHESPCILALDEDQTSFHEVTRPEIYLAKCSFHCPVAILALLLNLGAIQQEDKGPALPCFVNQPGINNRNVDRDHVYDDNFSGKDNRDDSQYGTLETAWGSAPHNMYDQSYCGMFYEVHSSNSEEDSENHARLMPSLDKLGISTRLIGNPVARPLTVDSALTFFLAVTGIDPSDVFSEGIKSTKVSPEKDHSGLANQIVSTALVIMRDKFHNLASPNDWWALHSHLKKQLGIPLLVSVEESLDVFKECNWATKIARTSKETENLVKNLPEPSNDVELRRQVWLLTNCVSPVRIGYLDGNRRVTGALYGLMKRIPETSIETLQESFDFDNYQCKNVWVSEHDVDMKQLSTWAPVSVVRVCTTESNPSKFSALVMNLFKLYSGQLQRTLDSSHHRQLHNTIVGILQSVESLGEQYAVMGEIKFRDTTIRKENSQLKNDSDRNKAVCTEFRKYVITQMYHDTTASVQRLIKDATDPKKGFVMVPGKTQLESFVDSCTKTMNDNNVAAPFTSTRYPKSRGDVLIVPILISNYVHDRNSLDNLVNLAQMKCGRLTLQIDTERRAHSFPSVYRNMEGKSMGFPGEDGKLYGVSSFLINWTQIYRNALLRISVHRIK